jgi:tRNA(Arg) A34 adenosine deaminase TadA
MTKPVTITAIIFDKRGRPLSIGQNSYAKTHRMQAELAEKVGLPDKIFLHGEIAAIVKCKDLSKAHKIFVSRYDKNGKPMNAKPCPICQEAIKLAGIRFTEYTQ